MTNRSMKKLFLVQREFEAYKPLLLRRINSKASYQTDQNLAHGER